MNQARAERIAREMQEELGAMLQREVKDPRIGFVSVTHVKVSRDLSWAKVYVSILGDAEAVRQSLEGLQSAAGYLRGEVARRLGLRLAPQLEFRLDPSIAESVRLGQLMKQLPPPAPPEPDQAP
ncbi:MAG: 30S ribosome-binding factor RbfA [Firmicutes bacterium]|nr:30S ribosome-binding factor RbfA [Alicyclobacillaceae bacterium]MCL6496818.1 30S ribosome-binding factor RbfA [Bacillota bacterium]